MKWPDIILEGLGEMAFQKKADLGPLDKNCIPRERNGTDARESLAQVCFCQ